MHETPSNRITLASLALLLTSLVAVVLLAKVLSYPLDIGIAAAGLPQAFVGVVIAAIVLLPEGLAAAKSALLDRLQNSINLALGSAIATIGLTIPTVAIVSLALHRQIALGVSPTNMTLLVLTLFVGTLTLGTGRTTVLQGVVHLVIFARVPACLGRTVKSALPGVAKANGIGRIDAMRNGDFDVVVEARVMGLSTHLLDQRPAASRNRSMPARARSIEDGGGGVWRIERPIRQSSATRCDISRNTSSTIRRTRYICSGGTGLCRIAPT